MKKTGTLKLIILSAIALASMFTFIMMSQQKNINVIETYLSSSQSLVEIYDLNFNKKITLPRGTKIITQNITLEHNNQKYIKIKYENNEYLVLKENIDNEIVQEKTTYVRTPVVLYENSADSKIISYIKKGEQLNIIGYDYINTDGTVNMYNVTYNNLTGYVYSKYLIQNEEEANKHYDNGYYEVHSNRGNTLGGGDAGTLDYYPYEKPKFENNIMPEEVRSIYINSKAISNIDEYINLAKETNINAFVVDIKDNTSPAYKSDVMKNISITNYNNAALTIDEYKNQIKKIKDNGFYVIGRITVFKDDYYATDNSNEAIFDTRTNKPYSHNGSYWPSAYSRNVWYFNVELAKEAITTMGFNEIQFDYVRFPDKTSSIEPYLDYKNKYNETKAQAIQGFVMYACDELHKLNTYVSIDVFAESAHPYVTSYGQYFPAISNIADVVSAMPYPDHFNKNQYGFKAPVWTVPYDLLNHWGKNYVIKRQEETTTPAILRTWIQAYDTIREPYITYDTTKVTEQINGLYDAGLTGGYITWNSSSSLMKYNSLKEAFSKKYKE